MKKIAFCSLFALLLFQVCLAQTGRIKQIKLSQFQLQSSVLVSESGKELSDPAFRSGIYWLPVKVPSTVLTGLVANHIYPDPYQGLNNMLIPDASDQFNKEYNLEQYSHLPNHPNPWNKPYWYRTSFTVPAADKGRVIQLILKGINYRAAVWLNGKQIADSSQIAGMFAEHNLDISKAVLSGKLNALAIEIYPLDYPGYPAKEQLQALGPFYENGGPTGDIGKNVTMLCSVGWDWIPPVRDRNMGIWQSVYLRTTGAVTIAHPQIKTDLPSLSDTSLARLTLSLNLANHSDLPAEGKLQVEIRPENFKGTALSFEKTISLKASELKEISLNADQVKALVFSRPHLWWPNGLGSPNLYRIRLKYIQNGMIADDTSFAFGVRTVSSKSTDVAGFNRRDFYVNGKRVNLVGGAWVPDMMVNRDSTRFDYEMHLCRNANVNLVRIWGGGVTEPDDFWNAADRYGLMVWSDFWVTGDTQGEFKGSPDWPLESSVFIRNVISTIYRVRNHPSLLVWTGGNEGHARKELYDAMRNNVIALDGTRPFIPSSSGFAKLPQGWEGAYPDNKTSGVYSSGPYAWTEPKEYYRLANEGKGWVFKDETGIPSQPPYNTLIKIIPDLAWDQTLPFPLNNSWGYHDAATGAAKYDEYYKTMVNHYGEAKSMQSFSDKMQLMNAVGYQGIFEAAGHKLNESGGVMLWKLNAAFPSVVWQIYDWYLEPNAGYYFMQNACETRHIQFNQDDSTVALINRSFHSTGRLSATADVFSIDSKNVAHKTGEAMLPGSGTKSIFSLKETLRSRSELSFVVLNLKDASGFTVSHNVYWLAPGNDLKKLNEMKTASLETKVLKSEKSMTERTWTIKVRNNSDQLAFFIRPQLMTGKEEVMPSYWSSSYFSLAPHEDIILTLKASLEKMGGAASQLHIGGWNVGAENIVLL